MFQGKVWFDLFKDLFSLFYVELPISLAGENFLIKFDVVDSDLPFLLRKKRKSGI